MRLVKKVKPALAACALFKSGETNGHVQHAHDGRAERPGINHPRARRIRAGNAPLPVCRPGQRDARPRAGERVRRFRRIAHRINVRVGRFHAAVGFHAAGRADFQAGSFGEFHFRLHAHAQQDQVRRELAAIGQLDAIAREPARRLAFVLKSKSRAANLVLQVRRHVAVQQRQDVRVAFNDGDVEAAMMKRLGHFQPDEAAADDDGALGPAFVHETRQCGPCPGCRAA